MGRSTSHPSLKRESHGFSRGRVKKRTRRPPTDPVNAVLSLGYTFLFNELMGAVSMVGLDPYFGALHTVEYGKPSLVLDLMEEWRPVLIDTLILSLFNMNVITNADFTVLSPSPDGERLEDETLEKDILDKDKPSTLLRLTKDGLRKFIAQYERKIRQKIKYHLTGKSLSYRDCIREQIRHFARYLKGEDPEYKPVPFK